MGIMGSTLAIPEDTRAEVAAIQRRRGPEVIHFELLMVGSGLYRKLFQGISRQPTHLEVQLP